MSTKNAEADFALANYNFILPPELIAQYPTTERAAARLLVHTNEKIAHQKFRALPDYLTAGDLLVFNNTQVIPARLLGQRATGGKVEVLLVAASGGDKCLWTCLARPLKNLRVGEEIIFGDDEKISAILMEKLPNGQARLAFAVSTADFFAQVEKIGKIPLPPYIDRAPTAADKQRYQTVYAKIPGAVAAPTAGLHFTPELLTTLKNRGIETAEITLHVGPGTFKPIKTADIRAHAMDFEYYQISAAAAEKINRAKKEHRRVIAVGTTATRTLESAAAPQWAINSANEYGELLAGEKWTNLFIMPHYRWRIVDGIITNFHLPQSSLLVLVAAKIGRARALEIYQTAIAEKYRFYSYGDAMLII